MSNIFITNIIGTIDFAVPTNDTDLGDATTALDAVLSTLSPDLIYGRIIAWVEDSHGPGGATGARTLNCLVEGFLYLTLECPSEAEIDALGLLIETTLVADHGAAGIIASVDVQQYNLFYGGANTLWKRDIAGGFLYPATSSDRITVGGTGVPTGCWFAATGGGLALGSVTRNGVEKFYIHDDDVDSPTLGAYIKLEKTGVANKRNWSGSSVVISHTDGSCEATGYSGHVATCDYAPDDVYTLASWGGFREAMQCDQGDVLKSYGFYASCDCSGGVIVDRRGFNIKAPVATGNISYCYGIYIERQNALTLSYGIYQDGADNNNYFAGPIVVGADAVTGSSSSIGIELSSTTRALLVSRMTEVQRDALVSPVVGTILWNNTASKLQVLATTGPNVWRNLH
jgi:hypothetical protein